MSGLAPHSYLYENPSGPGDARLTAAQIIKDQHLEDSLVGKTILITGATSGIGMYNALLSLRHFWTNTTPQGMETARALYDTGAQIFITARDAAKGA